jgi:ankyrin repeat protein
MQLTQVDNLCGSNFYRTLFESAAKNDLLLMERALSGELGDLELSDLNQALIRAAQNGNAECVSRLLAEGADIDCDDVDGDTPLMLAAANDHIGGLIK